MRFQVEKHNQKRDKSRGAVLVELAVMLPFLAVLLLGVMEFSVILHNKSVITNASREGARYGIAAIGGDKTDAQIGERVNSYVSSRLISFPSAQATTTVGRGGGSTPNQLRVKVTYPYKSLILPTSLSSAFAGQMSLNGETKMEMED